MHQRLFIEKLKCATLLLVLASGVFPVMAGGQSAAGADSTAPSRGVLIVKRDSYLENTVSAIVKDSLSAKGFSVKIISPESLKDEQPADYRAAIVMSAIQSSKKNDIERSWARRFGAGQSNVIIFTVYGEEWKNGKAVGDAVAGATKKLNPAVVAAGLLERIGAIVAQ
jgi:hypothetical protein